MPWLPPRPSSVDSGTIGAIGPGRSSPRGWSVSSPPDSSVHPADRARENRTRRPTTSVSEEPPMRTSIAASTSTDPGATSSPARSE